MPLQRAPCISCTIGYPLTLLGLLKIFWLHWSPPDTGVIGQLGAVAIDSATANPAATAMAAAATAATLTYTPIAGWQFVLAVLGFMTQKVVLVGVSMVDADFGAGNDGAAGGGGGAPLELIEKQS